MNRFTQAYDAARRAVRDYEFTSDWKAKLDLVVGVKDIVAAEDGPKITAGIRLNALRGTIKAAKAKGATEGKTILSMVGVSNWGLSSMKKKDSDAAATLKMLRHLYQVRNAGAQTVWIYAQPFSFHKWVFDELDGRTGWSAESKLSKVDEVYDSQQRKHMGGGVGTALAWCQKCVSKLGDPNQKTKAIVKTWFCDEGSADSVDAAAVTLNDGFKKISALLSSNKLIFSDEPIDRMKGDKVKGQKHYRDNWEDYAFVDAAPRERLDAVYIQGGTLEKWGSADKAWMATLAIIHELSHRVLNTKDVIYDFKGLKPNDKLTFEHAIKNADSWAYFAADMNGALTESARKKYYKGPKQLRQAYLDTLTS